MTVEREPVAWLQKLQRCSEWREPCTIRPSEADAIISELQQLRRALEVGQRTSHARKLAFEAASATTAEAKRLRALVEEAKRVLEPFADKSKRFDDACRSLGEEVPKGSVKPITEFTHAHLRAARALRDRLGVKT